jgi:ABC-type glycerol-3-phosphate transport system substrate-binding protein
MRFRTPAAAIAVALALATGIAACGGDEDDTTDATTATTEAASAETVTVTTGDTADGYSWDVSATPTADTKTVEFVNDSKEAHALIFARLGEGFTIDEAFELEGRKGSATTLAEGGAGPGQTGSLKVKETVEPGSYVLLCPISGKQGPHYKLGQLAEFEIG